MTLSPSPMVSQTAKNEAPKQITMTLQSYSSQFSEINTFITDIKSSVDQIKYDIINYTAKFQEIDLHLDIIEVKLEELDY